MEEEIAKLKVQNLIALRQMLMTNLLVIGGGVVGIAYTENSFLKCFLIASGVWLLYVFTKNLYSTKQELDIIPDKRRVRYE
jgi:hypothetical protein